MTQLVMTQYGRALKNACGNASAALAIIFLGLAIALASSTVARAQTFYGSLVGTVTDNTGAVVPGATVTITNLGTNDSRTVKTDAAGDYRVVSLVPANYKVAVEAPHFKGFLRQPIQVAVDTTIRVDAKLEVGAASQTVEVTTQAPLLQTESGSLGGTVQGTQVQAMPLNGRNPLNLVELVPGVVPQGNALGGAVMNSRNGTTSAAWGNFAVGGSMPLQETMYLDGAPLNVLNKNFAGMVPTQDVIQEFKVETSGVSAEFGRFGGGVVTMATKTGTNAFHGSVYEYFRNNVLNANYFFSNRSGEPRPQWNQNQFGVDAGGPIWKDKAFFFFNWEGIHIRTGAPYLTNIPTPAMQQGVIPEVYKGSTLENSNVHDPRGLCNVTHQAGTPSAPGTWTITNLSSCEDTTAAVLATFYPNKINNPGNPADNYFTAAPAGTDGHQLTGRVDFNISNNDRLFGRFTLWNTTDISPNYMNNANGWDSANTVHFNSTDQYVVGDTYTFNPTTLLDVHVDYLREFGGAIPPATGSVDMSKFGSAYATLAPYMSFPYYPTWSFSGGTELHNLFNFSYSDRSVVYYNNYHFSADLTKIVGKHTLKIGADGLLQQREDVAADQAGAGSFTFSDDLGGDEWANFLFGTFDKGTITTAKATTTFNLYSGYYLEDTWQARPKLTLNMGLRYALPGAPTENSDNATVLLPDTTDPNTGIYGTVGLVSSSLYDKRSTLVPFHNAWGPRFGFAYRLTDNTVIRGGYALSYLANDAQGGSWASSSPINSASTVNTNTATNLKPGCTTATPTPTCYVLSNPYPVTAQYPNGIAPALGRENTNFMHSFIGGSVSAPDPYEPYPHSQSMNLSVGHQFASDLAVDISGVHTLGTHLMSVGGTTGKVNGVGLDQLPDQYDSLGSALLAAPSSPIVYDGVKLPSAYQTYGQTLRPYPAYNNYVNASPYHGTASYNALEVTLQKRFRAAGEIGASYTWSKLITDTDTNGTSQETESGGAGGNGEGLYQDYTNPKAERSLYSYNVPNRLVVNYVLSLPFGKGQRFAPGVHGAASTAISGWSVDGITTFQSGYPLYMNVSANNLSKYFGAGTIRPNYTAGCSKTNSVSPYDVTLATINSPASQRWFNTSCFKNPGAFAFGSEPRVDPSLKSQGVDDWDFAIQKSTPIHERLSLQFRAEFFNIFNHVQYAPPVTQADNTQFGLILQQANQPRLIQASLRLDF